MNEIVYKCLLAGDNFLSEMHLRQPGFTNSACGSFTKNKDTRGSRYIYQNELDKTCFQLEIFHMIDIKGLLLQWFLNFLIKNYLVEPL